jgi:hypothetical protein
MHCADERASGEIAIDDDFEDVVVAIGAAEVPVVISGFVEEVEAIHSLHPADFDVDVEVFAIVLEAEAVHSFFQLVHADGIGGRDEGPIRALAVDLGNFVWRKLIDLVLDAGAFEGEGREEESGEEEREFHFLILSRIRVR